MGAEFRLVRADGGPLDISEEELSARAVLGLNLFFERLENPLPRSIRIEAIAGFEETAEAVAAQLAESLELVAIDLTTGTALSPGARAPWWAYWRGR